jgi:hypothetical protein
VFGGSSSEAACSRCDFGGMTYATSSSEYGIPVPCHREPIAALTP